MENLLRLVTWWSVVFLSPTKALIATPSNSSGAAVKSPNSTIFLNQNNVKGLVGKPGVELLGVVDSLAMCEALCENQGQTPCKSFTWHHADYVKPRYQRHCYGHTDSFWAPVPEDLIDSGRLSGTGPMGCTCEADCAFAGTCVAGACVCRRPWSGPRCATLDLAPMNVDPSATGLKLPHNWTWGGSVIRDSRDGRYHMYVMHLKEHCGIQCYQSNGQVLHATANAPEGPFTVQGVALDPRPGKWDSDTLSEPSVYRAPDGTFLLFYMGLNDTVPRPFNCMKADTQCRGIGGVRKIGVAFATSLDGPWQRLDEPLLGPNPAPKDSHGSPNCDTHDVSNPAVAFAPNGSAIMAFKGEGHCGQGVMGFATAPHWRGPWTRPQGTSKGSMAYRMGARACEDPYIYWDAQAGLYRMLSHACEAPGLGGHFFSHDGLAWSEAWTDNITWAYNAQVPLANGHIRTFYRRERPQVLLDEHGAFECLYNAAQPCKATWGDKCHSYTMVQCTRGDEPVSELQ